MKSGEMGGVSRTSMTAIGKQKKLLQTYICKNNHFFTIGNVPRWDDSFIERVVYTYLRCLSLNTTIDLIRMFYEEDILTKGLILDFITGVADVLPTLDDIDRLYKPTRSGYIAVDGVWFSFGHEEIVLLVAFDPETFDVISARWETDETEAGYTQLLTDVTNKIGAVHVKGLYADGDNGLVARNYHHSATSFHLYNKDMPDLQNSPFLRNEGLLFYPNNQ